MAMEDSNDRNPAVLDEYAFLSLLWGRRRRASRLKLPGMRKDRKREELLR